MKNEIITIGLAPAWDKTIEIPEIYWNQHKVVSSQKIVPAGKALNISKALCWIGIENTSAGLWGSDDFDQMKEYISKLKKIKIKLTAVPGQTRENITIVDLKNKRQMHLRTQNTLADSKSIKILKEDLQKIIKKNAFAVVAGAMPDDAIDLIELAKKKNANVVVDTSGNVLRKIVSNGGLFLIKPNIEELSEIIGRKIKNETKEIITVSKKLLKKTKFILVSRGEKGATLIFNSGTQSSDCSNIRTISAKYIGHKHPVYNTVACGDYLLAGFLSVVASQAKQFLYSEQICASALRIAVVSATAKAFCMNETLSWRQAMEKLKVQLT